MQGATKSCKTCKTCKTCQISEAWTTQASVNRNGATILEKPLPIVLVGVLPARVAALADRITAEQALAAAGGAATAYFECQPYDKSRRGCAEMMKAVARLALKVEDDVEVELPAESPQKCNLM